MRTFVVVAAATLALFGGTARAAGPPVLGFSVSTGPARGALPVSLPSASTPNAPGGLSLPVDYTSHASSLQVLPLSALHTLWVRAGAAYGIPWQVLAAINKIESNFGQNMGPSSAGAVGWMQFMPSTWLRWGLDADGDGLADPWNATDAVYAAARYLAAAGGQTDISRGVFAYNHADWYVREVLDLANVYGGGGLTQTAGLEKVQQALDLARRRVIDANDGVEAAKAGVRRLQDISERLNSRIESAELLSDRLAADRNATLFDTRIDEARQRVDAARAKLENAQAALASAQQKAIAPSFSQGVGSLLGAPSFQGDYVFPVGGGPGSVSVGHTHHDYPAADIAAPAGSPVYALAGAVVLNAWHDPDARCGIGLTLRTNDGLVWTYCHLAYLFPLVTDGVTLSAGEQIGLVGSTGHATGPHLHLQLQPATSYPQEQPWFQAFAGRAFSWQDAPTDLEPSELAPATRVFAVVPDSSDAVIGFTRGGA
jgi:murein DD-endopeptidase MepM/ murein hydrolase activator NlpD